MCRERYDARMHRSELAGQRVTVMGLGRFGGGLAVTRFLVESGADVLVTDLADEESLAKSLQPLRPLIDSGAVQLRLGEHNVSDFTTRDLIVANPAVPKPWANRFLRAASAASIPITTEIRLGIERIPDGCRVIGVTGSAGKSTTAAMIAHAARACWKTGSVVFAGNIGSSLLDESLQPGDLIVLELSSAQLHWLGPDSFSGPPACFRPDVAVFTTLSRNHIDWHGSFEHYRESKRLLAGSDSTAVIASPQACDAFGFNVSVSPHPDIELAIPGRHNQQNASLALAALREVIGTAPDPRLALADFAGLPHRLQLIADTRLPRGRFRAFNDSKCTTPEGVGLAIEAFNQPGECGAERVWLIAGGYDKGTDPASLVEAAAGCAGVFCIGDTGATLAESVRARAGRAINAETLDRAVAEAAEAIALHDGESVLLLSPGFASWDQFANYEHRGEAFAKAVNRHFGDNSMSPSRPDTVQSSEN